VVDVAHLSGHPVWQQLVHPHAIVLPITPVLEELWSDPVMHVVGEDCQNASMGDWQPADVLERPLQHPEGRFREAHVLSRGEDPLRGIRVLMTKFGKSEKIGQSSLVFWIVRF
jgi:hypothetical protein